MHPASSKPSRSNIKIQMGPVSLMVDVYSGTYKAPSATRVCVGVETAVHVPTKLTPGSSNPARCSVCAEGVFGEVKSARPGDDGKLVVISEEAALEALEASAEHRDGMPLIRVPIDVLEQNALESAEVYWLSPSDGPNDLYAGLVQAIAELEWDAVITRWAPSKNVSLYRLVERGGVLGMVKLVAAETLRAAPNEPVVLEGDRAAQAVAMAKMALSMAPTVSAEELVEISGNPYTQIITAAATKAIESGVATVRMANQGRGTFGDTIAAARLSALLEGAEL